MPLLPANGTLSYNGVTFDSLYRSKMVGTPVKDSARRTVTRMDWRLEVDGYITVDPEDASPDDTTDSRMDNIRLKLTEMAGILKYSNKGFGSFEINSGEAGAKEDVLWGPEPELLNFDPIGNTTSVKVSWACTIHLSECVVGNNKITEFCYTVGYKVDADGYTTVTTSGHVDIAMTRRKQTDRSVPNSADYVLESICPEIPFGFRRTTKERTISENRNRIDFTFIDEELPPEGLPRGCTSATGRYTVRSALAGTQKWNATLSASYTVARNLPRSRAWELFKALLFDRHDHIQATRNKALKGESGPILMAMELNEGLYLASKESSFSVSFIFFCALTDILNGSAIWKPHAPRLISTEKGYDNWKASVNVVTGPRGFRGIRFKENEDFIVDLCGVQPAGKPPAPSPPTVRLPVPKPKQEPKKVQPKSMFGSPTLVSSWASYEMEAELYLEDSGVVTHKPLPQRRIRQVPTLAANVDAAAKGDVLSLALKPLQGAINAALGVIDKLSVSALTDSLTTEDDIVQYAATPTYRAFLRGQAMRWGFHVPIPELVSVGGKPVVAKRQRVRQRSLGNFAGHPMYGCVWDLEYEVPFQPQSGELVYPLNPSIEIAG
jgi:hypothetical protein